jgi:hypothetical protein
MGNMMMMSGLMHGDWQTLATMLIGLVAAAYLGQRWWPAMARLFGSGSGVGASAAHEPARSACTTQPPKATGASGCGSGCGQCGRDATPTRDHKVEWRKRASH